MQARVGLHNAVATTGRALSWLQLPITFVTLARAPDLAIACGLPAHTAHNLCAWALGVTAIVVLQARTLEMLYLDDARRAVRPLLIRAILNPLLSWMTLTFGDAWYGAPHAIVAWCAGAAGGFAVHRSIDRAAEETILAARANGLEVRARIVSTGA